MKDETKEKADEGRAPGTASISPSFPIQLLILLASSSCSLQVQEGTLYFD